MSENSTGWGKARPLRVAFLVQDGQYAQLQLDGIFADCYSRWGGRFSLIIPCDEAAVPAAYWEWLAAYDPDIVYSYVPLSRRSIIGLHERLYTAEYIYHEPETLRRLDVFGFKPSYRFTPLSSLSTIFRTARYNPSVSGEVSVKIIDCSHSTGATRFLTDNFGTYHTSMGTGLFPSDARTVANLLTVLTPADSSSTLAIPRDTEILPSELAAFKEFSQKRVTSLSLAALQFAPKLNVYSRDYGSSFNLVVGESFSDRILMWNARLIIPAWLDTDLQCLRISQVQLADAEFLDVIGKFLKYRNHVNGGSGGQPQLTIRSTSLDEAELAAAAERIRSTKPWCGVSTEKVGSLDVLIPALDVLRRSKDAAVPSDAFFARPEWTEFSWKKPYVEPPPLMPDHLIDAPSRQTFTLGLWATELTFEYKETSLTFSQGNRWALPRRWRMARAFQPSFGGGDRNHLPPPPRRSRDGRLTEFTGVGRPIQRIVIPDLATALNYAFCRDGAHARDDAENGDVYPEAKAVWMRPSNEGRYLNGVLGMVGGLEAAIEFFLHPFLADLFASLGGSPKVGPRELDRTVRRLEKLSKHRPCLDIREPENREALAHFIRVAAMDLKRPANFARHKDLTSQWEIYRTAYWQRNGGAPDSDKSVDWDAYEQGSLDRCLQALRERQVLFQGHRWTCHTCHHQNWVGLEQLKAILICEVCKQSEPAPVTFEWLFRANEFLLESFRSHSVLSVIWTLSALQRRCRYSFMFLGPTWFGFDPDSDAPDAEADLLALCDGQTLLCEVKSSWRGLTKGELDRFVALARRLRPDTALLAVMDEGSALEEDVEAANHLLRKEDIRFEVLTLDAAPFQGDTYLAGGRAT
jgi:hypothetical protein